MWHIYPSKWSNLNEFQSFLSLALHVSQVFNRDTFTCRRSFFPGWEVLSVAIVMSFFSSCHFFIRTIQLLIGWPDDAIIKSTKELPRIELDNRWRALSTRTRFLYWCAEENTGYAVVSEQLRLSIKRQKRVLEWLTVIIDTRSKVRSLSIYSMAGDKILAVISFEIAAMIHSMTRAA